MAFVYDTSFRPSADISSNKPYLAADMNELHTHINAILRKYSGPPYITDDGSLYTKVPPVLKASLGLKSNFKKIWDDTIVCYDPEAYGASANHTDLVITFGEFFTKPQPRAILEKVFWHEFLHLVIKLPRPMHHGKINHIIRHGIGLYGDPNPLGTVGLEC
jgi:hypothetical protein